MIPFWTDESGVEFVLTGISNSVKVTIHTHFGNA